MKTSKAKPKEMTSEAAARIRRHEAEKNDGKIQKNSFGSRADVAVQRRRSAQKDKSVQ